MPALAVALATAACTNPPPLVLNFALTKGPAQVCSADGIHPASTCSDVPLRCDSALSIRIVSPDDPKVPYVSVCQPILGRKNLCSIAGIDLPAPTRKIPAQTLEVQVAIYPLKALPPADPMTGELHCPADLQFAPDGLPLEAAQPCAPTDPSCTPTPAIGGRAFYHPGDTTTVVDLGCTDLHAVEDPTCAGPSTVNVAATIEDFDSDVAVPPAIADVLSVSIGEPKAIIVGPNTEYVLNPTDARVLPRTVIQPVPGWGGDVDLALMSTACLQVLEDAPQSTAALTCKTYRPGDTRVDITGFRLAKATLDQILGALGKTQFPPKGLVVGIVLDYLGNPAANFPVLSTAGSVEYLSGDRKQLIAGATSASGIFISRDAAYGTAFSTHDATGHIATGVGGLVDGKVTVVIVQFTQPGNGQ